MLNRLKTHTPAGCIAFAFILTICIARLMSVLDPGFHLELGTGRHIHHYVVGIFVLTLAGYVAMIFKGPRATFWIALLYGFGVGLTFDEFGMWLSPRIDPITRWSEKGIGLVIAGLILCSLIPILRRQAIASQRQPAREVREVRDLRDVRDVQEATAEPAFSED